MRVLDVGCGNNKTHGAIGIDISCNSQCDAICDLNNSLYPFKDSVFDAVICKQVIEHLPDSSAFLKELYRLVKSGGRVIIQTPHFSCYLAHADYQHCHTFSVFFLDKLAERIGFKITKREITFHRNYRRYKINWWANKFPLAYERFWTYIFPAEHMYFELEVIKA